MNHIHSFHNKGGKMNQEKMLRKLQSSLLVFVLDPKIKKLMKKNHNKFYKKTVKLLKVSGVDVKSFGNEISTISFSK